MVTIKLTRQYNSKKRNQISHRLLIGVTNQTSRKHLVYIIQDYNPPVDV